jgi:phosphoribosylanthranilate isomerase
VRVKICGLTLPDHAAAAHEAGAEFVGLVFAERSRRRVTVEQARAITAALPPRTEPPAEVLPLGASDLWFRRCAAALDELIARGRPLVVGVFVNQPVTLVNSIAEAADLDLVQLSGDEPWETCLALRRPVIKALRVSGGTLPGDVLGPVEAGTAALCLLDADVPGEFGGTGQATDWDVAAEAARVVPVMLAGGLTPANVADAVMRVQPWAVDVSSGVEREGVKDVALIQKFVRAAKGLTALTPGPSPVGTGEARLRPARSHRVPPLPSRQERGSGGEGRP